MDPNTGWITEVEYKRMPEGMVPVHVDHLSRRRKRELELFGRTKIGRNEKCPCGSGKKFKRCCNAKLHSSRAEEGEE